MNSFEETLSQHRRITILRFLNDSPEYTSNASIILEICNDVGVKSSFDQVKGELEWLKSNRMLTYKDHDGFIVAVATKHGIDIAEGRARHDGVKRPSPES
jgi:hypothetical protein